MNVLLFDWQDIEYSIVWLVRDVRYPIVHLVRYRIIQLFSGLTIDIPLLSGLDIEYTFVYLVRH